MLLFSENPVETHNVCPDCHKRSVEVAYRGPEHLASDTERMVRRSYHLGPVAPRVAHQLHDEVERWTYKPGWKLWIEYRSVGDPFGQADHLMTLCIRFKALDSRGSGAMIPIAVTIPVPMVGEIGDVPLGEGQMEWFRDWLAMSIQEAERHESREWLRRDGELHDDPHRTDKR